MASPAPPLEHVRPRPERGRDAQPVDHLKVRQQRPAVAMARAPAHVLPRPAASVHLIAAARLVRVRARDRVSANPARLPRVITVCTWDPQHAQTEMDLSSLHPSILPPRRTSDSVHSGSKEGPSLSQSTVGMGFLRQLEPLGTC